MIRYWEIKTKNFDKVVLQRWGHWFIVFYQDASICNKLIDLCIPPRQRMQIFGFHENHLEDNIEVLVSAGNKVAISEQIENGIQMEERIKEETKNMTKEEAKKVVKAVKREVSQILTKGTHFKTNIDPKNLLSYEYDTKYVLAYYNVETRFGYCYFDMSTLKFYTGTFDDDFTLKQFRTLVM